MQQWLLLRSEATCDTLGRRPRHGEYLFTSTKGTAR